MICEFQAHLDCRVLPLWKPNCKKPCRTHISERLPDRFGDLCLRPAKRTVTSREFSECFKTILISLIQTGGAILKMDDEERSFASRDLCLKARYFLLNQSLGKAAAQVVRIARINYGVGEVLTVVGDVAIGHIKDGDANIGFPDDSIGQPRNGVHRIEEAGFPADR